MQKKRVIKPIKIYPLYDWINYKNVKKMEYTNQQRYKHKVIDDRDWGPGKTVPGMALSIKEILLRAIEGRPVPSGQIQE